MTTPLLTAKLSIPPPRPNLVPRDRLISKLEEGLALGCKLTLVSAPAGYGKTTLLAGWIAARSRPVAWISLEKDDNDPVRFLTYLTAALRSINPGIGEGVLESISAQPFSLDAPLTTLINQVNTVVRNRLILVLDDYHLITNQTIVNALDLLVNYLPDLMHLVIASRNDPAIPIARLRGRGQMTELGQADLRFNAEETATFLSRVKGVSLSAENIAALDARIEGWVAGLQMAAIAMQSTVSTQADNDIASFIQAFTGSNRFVLDYLVEEVLQRQPGEVESFLVKTSILERMTAPLCNAVTGENNGQAMLIRLEQTNLFIVPLDNERTWYRYHRLFADLLRCRLQQTQSGAVPELCRRASQWYEQNNYAAEAIDYAIQAGDMNRSAQLIEQVAEIAMQRSEVASLQRWLAAIPDEMVRARPILCIYHAMTLLLSGAPLKDAQDRLNDAENAGVDGSVSGEALAIRAWIAAHQGEMDHYADLSRQALERLPEKSRFFRSIAAGFIGLNSLFRGEVETLDMAVRMRQETGEITMAVLTLCHSADLARIQGKLYRTEMLYEQALELATTSNGQRQPIAGLAMIGLGRLHKEWNHLDEAHRNITEGIELAQAWSKTSVIQGYVSLAQLKQAQGDNKGALEPLKTGRRLANRSDSMQPDIFNMAMQEARLELVRGNVPAALACAATYDLEDRVCLTELDKNSDSQFSILQKLDSYTTLAWLRLARGQADESLTMLASLLQTATDNGWIEIVIETLTLQALAYQSRNDKQKALAALEQALSLAEPEGYVRLFVDKGLALASLLRQAASRNNNPRYALKLLVAFGLSQAGKDSTVLQRQDQALEEPLTEREIKLVQYLPTHLSSTEIAQELTISANTVRFHIKNIYGKLNVHNRDDAVQRAKELGLL